jgi:hypothetical protein
MFSVRFSAQHCTEVARATIKYAKSMKSREKKVNLFIFTDIMIMCKENYQISRKILWHQKKNECNKTIIIPVNTQQSIELYILATNIWKIKLEEKAI